MRVRIALLAAVLLVAGCGGGDSSGGGGGGTVKLNVGVVPVSTVAPVYIGIHKGFFRAEKLDVTPKISQGGAEVVPAVLSDDVQVGYSNNVSLLVAASKGLPVQIVAGASSEAGQGAKPSQLLSEVFAKKGGSVRSAADLPGKTIAVNTVKNIGDVTIKAALEQRGVDAAKVKFTEMELPDMLPALESGRVDAIWVTEPFKTQAAQAGHPALLRNYYETRPGLSTTSYFVSKKWADENSDVVERFQRAIHRSLAYANAHPEEVRKVLPEYTKIPGPLVQKVALGHFPTAVDRSSLELLSGLMQKYGLVSEPPNLHEVVRGG